MNKIKLAVIVPTRNRAELAINAVNSALAFCCSNDIGIIISDNSTDIRASSLLDTYALNIDPRVQIIRPAIPAGMTAHWNFAVEHALSDRSFTHFTILTDRMLFKSGSIKEIMRILKFFPTDVMSYTYERIHDLSLPVVFRPLPRSGKLIRIESSKMLVMSANMAFPSCLPRMLNSVCTREHLLALKLRCGQIFASVAPDFNFCYHTLDMCESFIFYDDSLMINYAQGRSNGGSFSRGVMTKDSQDFIAHLGGVSMNECSPLPEIPTVGNSIVHEYCVEKRLSSSGKLPDVSIEAYMDFLASEVLKFENRESKDRPLRILREHGWRRSLRFRVIQRKNDLIGWLLGFRSRKFDTVSEAISFASTHRETSLRWFPHPARSYGMELRSYVSDKKGADSYR
jgi:hypothetical protein